MMAYTLQNARDALDAFLKENTPGTRARVQIANNWACEELARNTNAPVEVVSALANFLVSGLPFSSVLDSNYQKVYEAASYAIEIRPDLPSNSIICAKLKLAGAYCKALKDRPQFIRPWAEDATKALEKQTKISAAPMFTVVSHLLATANTGRPLYGHTLWELANRARENAVVEFMANLTPAR